jgi:serine/threonine protein kinase
MWETERKSKREREVAKTSSGEWKSGNQVNGWVLGKELSSGGQGVVWVVRRDGVAHAPPRAIKLVRTSNGQARRRFTEEVELMQRLAREHVVPIVDADVSWTNDYGYYVMPLAYGTLEEDRYTSDTLLTLTRLVRIGNALHSLHQEGYLHRDIKPSNILLFAEVPDVRLGDFGIAREEAATRDLTEMHEVVGTQDYRAPEVMQGRKHTQASEVFSFGRVLQRVLCGSLDSYQVQPGRSLSPAAAAALEAVIARATLFRPSDRFASVQELIEELPALWIDRQLIVAAAEQAPRAVGDRALQPPEHPSASDVRGEMIFHPRSLVGHLDDEMRRGKQKPKTVHWVPLSNLVGLMVLRPLGSASKLTPLDAKRLLDRMDPLRIPGERTGQRGMAVASSSYGHSLVEVSPSAESDDSQTTSFLTFRTDPGGPALLGFFGDLAFVHRPQEAPLLSALRMQSHVDGFADRALRFVAERLPAWLPCRCTVALLETAGSRLELPSADGRPWGPQESISTHEQVIASQFTIESADDESAYEGLQGFYDHVFAMYAEDRAAYRS